MRALKSPYFVLIKPRITFMILIATLLGYFLAGGSMIRAGLIFSTVMGTALSCAGAATLNNYLERDADSKMQRTCMRPLPSGQVSPADALAMGILLCLAGTIILVWRVNLLTGFLALLTCFLYVLVYTPLKRKTWLNTLIGAIPGAMPPLGGWAAATGNLDMGAWIIFIILFIWQHPHFYAIAWIYREDYARGGFKMLPVVEPDGSSTFRQIIVFSALLIAASLIPYFFGSLGVLYLSGALLAGVATLYYGVIVSRSRSIADARRLFGITLLYQPLLLICIILEAGL